MNTLTKPWRTITFTGTTSITSTATRPGQRTPSRMRIYTPIPRFATSIRTTPISITGTANDRPDERSAVFSRHPRPGRTLRAMNFPPRVIVAGVVAAVLIILAACSILALPRIRGLGLTATQRWLLAAAVAGFLAVLAAWVIGVLPAYWD